MKRNRIMVMAALWMLPLTAVAQVQLSFEEALQLLSKQNRRVKIADKGIEIARMERGKLNALWYPSLQGAGSWVHLSQKIEVKQPLSQFTDPAKDFVHSILPNDQLISSILDQIGSNTLVFPLAPSNLTTVDLTAEWVLFAGGKRVRAGRIGQAMVDLAHENRAQVTVAQQTLLTETYYGLRLARQVVAVRQATYAALRKHYEDALKLEENGMIDRAGRLFAQVNKEEAKREFEAARKDETVMQRALKSLLKQASDSVDIEPTSPLFMNDSLPPRMLFDQAVGSGNALLGQLRIQERIAHEQVGIDRSGYLPNIALFGKQTLYSKGIQRNLVPRSMVGVGFTWNLFDGLEREKRIRQSRLIEQTVALSRAQAEDDLLVAVDKLYTQLQKAQESVQTLNATIALSEELVRIRKRSFAEGMATSLEVIDAETMLAKVQVARLAAYYEYDVSLMQLLSICGTTQQFGTYRKISFN